MIEKHRWRVRAHRAAIQIKMFGDNELAIATYLTEAFPTEDFAKVLSALKTAIRAQNVQDLAKDAGLRRERLYHTFNGGVDPQLSRVMKLFKALNVRLSTRTPARGPCHEVPCRALHALGALLCRPAGTELSLPRPRRLVTNCGRLCLHRKKINVSVVLAGQKLGIKEVDEGIWLVSFMHYDLGYFDLEQKTLQPLDNPFGPRPVTDVSAVTAAPT
jgi:probable addiction module antidote protein